jgi:Flp pilus assembly pilin Flp
LNEAPGESAPGGVPGIRQAAGHGIGANAYETAGREGSGGTPARGSRGRPAFLKTRRMSSKYVRFPQLPAPAAEPWHSGCDVWVPCGVAPRVKQTNTCGDAAHSHRRNGADASGEVLMSNLITFVKSFSNQEDGQDLLEYALLVALIALIAIGAVGMAGTSVSTIFTGIANGLNAAS